MQVGKVEKENQVSFIHDRRYFIEKVDVVSVA